MHAFQSPPALLGPAAAAAGSLPTAVLGPWGPTTFDLLIKGRRSRSGQSLRGMRDIGIRNGVIEVQPDIPGDGAQGTECERTAGDPGAHRFARAYLSIRFRDRHSGRRAGAFPGHDDRRVGRRRGREQLCRLSALHRRLDAHAPLCVCAHCQHGPGGISRRRALQHRLRPNRACRADGGGKPGHRAWH